MKSIVDYAAHCKRQKRINHAGLYADSLITWHATYGDHTGLAREMWTHGSASLEFRADGDIEAQIVQRGAFWLRLDARAPSGAWITQLRAAAASRRAELPMPQQKKKCPSCLAMEVFSGDVCEFCAELPAVLGAQKPLWAQLSDPAYYEGTDTRGTQVHGR